MTITELFSDIERYIGQPIRLECWIYIQGSDLYLTDFDHEFDLQQPYILIQRVRYPKRFSETSSKLSQEEEIERVLDAFDFTRLTLTREQARSYTRQFLNTKSPEYLEMLSKGGFIEGVAQLLQHQLTNAFKGIHRSIAEMMSSHLPLNESLSKFHAGLKDELDLYWGTGEGKDAHNCSPLVIAGKFDIIANIHTLTDITYISVPNDDFICTLDLETSSDLAAGLGTDRPVLSVQQTLQQANDLNGKVVAVQGILAINPSGNALIVPGTAHLNLENPLKYALRLQDEGFIARYYARFDVPITGGALLPGIHKIKSVYYDHLARIAIIGKFQNEVPDQMPIITQPIKIVTQKASQIIYQWHFDS